MLDLYQLHWSHYVEKVQWGLNYKRLRWRAIDIDPFAKQELRDLGCKLAFGASLTGYTVPAIFDHSYQTALADSSPILAYLEERYPGTPTLFPGDRAEIYRWMLWLDSELGTRARRLAYAQIVVEDPVLLTQLFLPHAPEQAGRPSVRARLSAVALAGLLNQRFRLCHNRADRVFEGTARVLAIVAKRLAARPFLVGDRFSAADITLAALLRPLRIVPGFRQHRALQPLFQWQEALFEEHGRTAYVYEIALTARRNERGWMKGRPVSLREIANDNGTDDAEGSAFAVAANDQHPVSKRLLALAPLDYFRLRHLNGMSKMGCV